MSLWRIIIWKYQIKIAKVSKVWENCQMLSLEVLHIIGQNIKHVDI